MSNLSRPRFISLRTKFLLITLVGAVVPMGLVGYWLTAAARQSGAELLHERLDTTLANVALEVGNRWVEQRSALLSLAEDSGVRRGLQSGAPGAPIPVLGLRLSYPSVRDELQLVLVRDAKQQARWVLAPDAAGNPELVPAAESLRVGDPRPGEVVVVNVPVIDPGSKTRLGMVEARIRAAGMLPVGSGSTVGAGAVIAMVDRTSGASVVPVPFDVALLGQERFQWEGGQWLTARRSLDEPAVDLFAAAPLDAYVAPFERAAARGLFALLLVATAAIAVATLLTRRITRSLQDLAAAAAAVAAGDLDRQVTPRGDDEVSRVTRAFNAMTDNLRRTLRELSQQQAVAAVGEFASALAHEVRNPLSAIRLNLQHLDETAKDQAALREPLGHALRDIERLNRTVAAALRVARSGRTSLEPIELWPVLDAATRAALPEFVAHGALLDLGEPEARAPVRVRGDAAALEQLFLNLLLNAAQALTAGGRAGITVEASGRAVVVVVWDTGGGMTPAERERVFDPFYSTKPEGTGLGLTLARRIVAAHGGAIDIESAPGAGTRVRVTLPSLDGRAPPRSA